jgi:hypothetical protein
MEILVLKLEILTKLGIVLRVKQVWHLGAEYKKAR